jgi:uncharacterized circularly permuted ATP-grasp superfamily protein
MAPGRQEMQQAQTQTQDLVRWDAYDSDGYYCEMLGRDRGAAAAVALIRERIGRMSMAELRRRAELAERELFSLGITFTVYSERDAIDRILPFDVIPRVLTAADWRTIETGVQQRRRLPRPGGLPPRQPPRARPPAPRSS